MVNRCSGVYGSLYLPANAWPLVSVVIPAYNAERFIRDALMSVRAQEYAPLEVILIDDGSTDDTVKIARECLPDLTVIRQENGGVAAARNAGLRCARGEFMCLLDADDGWYPGKLHAQVTYLLKNPDIGAAYHSWQVWRPDGEGNYAALEWRPPPDPLEVVPAKSGWIYPQLLMDCIIHTSTIMLRRQFVEAVGPFRTELINGEDYDLWLRLSRLTRIAKLRGVYSFYRAAPGSLTTASARPVNYEYNVVCSALERWGRHAPDGSEAKKAEVTARLAKLAFDFAYQHFQRGSPYSCRRAALQALRHDPWRWRALLFLLASFLRAE